jgi:hypothetical protein
MYRARPFNAAALLFMAIALTFLIVSCTESPTSPQLTDNQTSDQLVSPSDKGTQPDPLMSAGYVTGVLPSGGLYAISVPDLWNGDVVIYAHGYVRPMDPLALPDDSVGGTPIAAIINSLGYA